MTASTLTPRIAEICILEIGCLYATIASDSSASAERLDYRHSKTNLSTYGAIEGSVW